MPRSVFAITNYEFVWNIITDNTDYCFIKQLKLIVNIFILKYFSQLNISIALLIDCESAFLLSHTNRSENGEYAIFKLSFEITV